MEEMIAAYVAEVGRRLPEKQRADIEREIRSLIEDTLEDESQAQGRPADEDMVVAVLKRLGPPETLAASYAPPRYLVGPALYPSYVLSLKFVLGITLAICVIGLAISATLGAGFGANASAPLEALRGLGQGGLNLVNVAIQVFGMVTIIYALIQRAAPGLKPAPLARDFDPRKLKLTTEPEAEPFKPVSLAIEMTLPLIALAIFNFYPQLVGMYTFKNGEWHIYPFFTAVFFSYVPFMNILWALEAVQKGSVLAVGRWTPALRWTALGLKALSLGMLAVILSGPDIIAISPDALAGLGSAGLAGQFNYWANFSMRLAVGIALVVTIIEIVVRVIQMLFGKKALSLGV